MPDLVGTTVAANYLKAVPKSQFGTRQLQILLIAQTGIDTNYANSNSLFSKTMRAVQQSAEIFLVGTPASGNVLVVVAADTVSSADSHSDPTAGWGLLEAAILAGSGVAATVTAKYFSGNGLTTGLAMNYEPDAYGYQAP